MIKLLKLNKKIKIDILLTLFIRKIFENIIIYILNIKLIILMD